MLLVHIVSGTLGLLLGPAVMWLDGRGRGRRTGYVYVGTVVVICASATVLVLTVRHDLWWLIPVSALTLGLTLLARQALSRYGTGWSHAYAHGQGGSYIALITATIVVSFALEDGPLTGPSQLIAWLGPTIIGTPLIELWRRRLVGEGVEWPPRGLRNPLSA
ncbi:hypothetical protein [Nocardia sp. NPDC051832]|uniref:hypothetical protein n=1 Tax=Nocardia sp. NPDC051832 TaxID=3155673 RepID=UPI003414DF4D